MNSQVEISKKVLLVSMGKTGNFYRAPLEKF